MLGRPIQVNGAFNMCVSVHYDSYNDNNLYIN